MEQVMPQETLKKVWPLMTPEERLAIWEEARRTWTHPAQDMLEHVERGRDEAARDVPREC